MRDIKWQYLNLCDVLVFMVAASGIPARNVQCDVPVSTIPYQHLLLLYAKHKV